MFNYKPILKRMKNFLKRQWLFLFIVVFVVGVSSCNDDDGPSNRISADGEGWAFSKGYIISNEDVTDTEGEVGSTHAIYLTGKGLTIEQDDDDQLGFEGEGHVTAFSIFSPDSDELEEGTYVIRTGNLIGNVAQFVMARDYSVPSGGGSPDFTTSYMGSYGTVEVSRSGDTYTFKFNIVEYSVTEEGDDPENGEGVIKGYFKGKLTRYEQPETVTARTVNSLPFEVL